MKDITKVSGAVIKRLPRYRRYLEELKRKNVERISSNEFSKLIGYTASQIRQDLNNFGGFGQQGYGYNVDSLHEHISIILGLDKDYNMIIVGSGNLGQAIANYTNYYKERIILKSMFDIDPEIIGTNINGIQVRDFNVLEDFLKENKIDIGVITTNKNSAQDVSNTLAEGGVRGIWNFTPQELDIPDQVVIENVHLSDSLNSLVYYINHKRT